jgi:hypothetical protein
MAVLKRDEFFNRLSARIGEDTSDEAMKDMEDFTDTYNALSSKAEGEAADWKRKYEENNENWKKKYKARFFSSGGNVSFPSYDEEEEMSEEDKELARATSIHTKDLFK